MSIPLANKERTCYDPAVPSRKKIDLEKVLAALDTICPKCGHRITPAESKRINFEEMECPACGVRFEAGKQ